MSDARISRKDISDLDVIVSCQSEGCSLDNLILLTGAPWKVCWRAMERADDRGYIDWGCSMRFAWPTDEGIQILENP